MIKRGVCDHVGVGVASDGIDVEDGEDKASDAPGEELEGDDEGEVAVCGVGELAGFHLEFHDWRVCNIEIPDILLTWRSH